MPFCYSGKFLFLGVYIFILNISLTYLYRYIHHFRIFFLPFLQVAYFDYLQLDKVSVPRVLPRISVYDDKIISRFCDGLSVMEDIQVTSI